jgi:hypothetical protein
MLKVDSLPIHLAGALAQDRERCRRALCRVLAHALLKKADIGQDMFGCGVAFDYAALAARLDVQVQIDRDSGVAGPARMRWMGAEIATDHFHLVCCALPAGERLMPSQR